MSRHPYFNLLLIRDDGVMEPFKLVVNYFCIHKKEHDHMYKFCDHPKLFHNKTQIFPKQPYHRLLQNQV